MNASETSPDTLCCPCSEKQPLAKSGDALSCSKAACPHAAPTKGFIRYGSTPVLIAFEKTDTICRASVYSSDGVYWPRNATRFMDALRRFVYGVPRISSRNCARFVEMMKERAASPSVLIIGSGSKGAGTDQLWNDPTIRRTGVDIYASPSVDYIADAHYLPFKDHSFEGVWIQAVLEHVASPAAVVAEIERVLKPGGAVYAETPFMQQVHEGAYDFSRFTVTGHRYLFRNFELIEMGGNGGPAFVLAWSVKYLVWGVTRSKTAGNAAALPFYLAAQILDRFVSEKSLWDASSGVFFLGRLNADGPVAMRDLPELYQGFQR